MTKKERRELIGKVSVDSGQVIICDPCYLTDKMDEKLYKTICDATTLPDKQASRVSDISGIASSSGFGDGSYDVYATFTNQGDWGERVSKLEIIFIGEDEIDEDD